MKKSTWYRDLLVMLAALCVAGVAVVWVQRITGRIDGVAMLIFMLAVFVTSMYTDGYLWGVLASLASVLAVNFAFFTPYFAFNFTLPENLFSGLVMLAVSIMTSTLTTRVKKQEQLRMETEREKMRANLLRSVSHDIRTPLTSIMGATSAILENPALSPAEQQSLLVDVRDDAQWLIRVVENLLSITRIGNESAKITKEPEAAEEVLDEAVRKFRKRFPAVSVEVHVPDELLLVPMDAILIMQVLSNLMENAVFHGGTTTHIALSAQRDGPWARFYVQDNGQGIPPQKLHTLFSGALRCEDSSPGDGKRNMGLGLSVCMAIIRAHGGTLEAKNLESGAEFSFCLPLTKEEVS